MFGTLELVLIEIYISLRGSVGPFFGGVPLCGKLFRGYLQMLAQRGASPNMLPFPVVHFPMTFGDADACNLCLKME